MIFSSLMSVDLLRKARRADGESGTLLLVLVTLGLTTATSVVATQSPAPPPMPAVVQSVEAERDGTLRLTPPVTEVTVQAGSGQHVDQRITNRTDHPMDLRLEPVLVEAGADGAPRFSSPTDSSPGLVLFDRALHLESGEQALLRPTVVRPDGAPPGVVALRAQVASDDEEDEQDEPLTGFVVVRDGASDGAATVAAAITRDGDRMTATMTLRPVDDQPTATDARIRARLWGLVPLADHSVHGLLLWPDQPRRIEVGLNAPTALGPVTLQAVAARGGEPTSSASATVWLWRTPVLVVVVLVLVAAGGVVAWRRRGAE